MMGGCCGGWGWWGGHMAGFGWIGLVFNLLLLVLLILAVVWGIRWLMRSNGQKTISQVAEAVAPKPQDPKQVLQMRYARGEITREEYLQMLADLEQDRA